MLDISSPYTGSAEKELEAINKMYMEKTANFNELLDACITYIGASRVWEFGYYFLCNHLHFSQEYVNQSRNNIAAAIKQLWTTLSLWFLQVLQHTSMHLCSKNYKCLSM